MTKILTKRDKYLIMFFITVCTRAISILVYAAYQLFKLMADGLYGAIRWFYLWFKYKDTGYSVEEMENMIRNMTPREFEVFTANLFRALGYDAELTQETADGGKDVILNNKVYVECKHFAEDNYIGRVILQKLEGAMFADKMEKGILVTTGKFHENAYEYARKTGNIELWDMSDIIEAIGRTEKRKVGYILHRLEA